MRLVGYLKNKIPIIQHSADRHGARKQKSEHSNWSDLTVAIAQLLPPLAAQTMYRWFYGPRTVADQVEQTQLGEFQYANYFCWLPSDMWRVK